MTRSPLFVSDLDGTLLNDEGRLSAFTRRGLVKLLDAGVPFTVATARAWHSVKPLFRGVPLTLPVVVLNGSQVTDPVTGRHLLVRAIPRAVAREVTERILRLDCHPVILTSAEDGDHCWFRPRRDVANMVNDLQLVAGGMKRSVKELHHCFEEDVVCVNVYETVRRTSALVRGLKRDFGSKLSIVFYPDFGDPSRGWISAYAAKSTKDEGIKAVTRLAKLGRRPVRVFGDAINDVPMFEAFHGVAVANAEAKILRLAKERIGDHASDAVVRYLLEACRPR